METLHDFYLRELILQAQLLLLQLSIDCEKS